MKKNKVNGKSIKCLRYIFDGAKDWVANQSLEKQNKFNNWVLNMNKHAYGKHGKVTNYYCISVGIPLIVFSVIPLSSMPCFVITSIVFSYNL